VRNSIACWSRRGRHVSVTQPGTPVALARWTWRPPNGLIENSEKGHSDGFAPVRIEGSRRGDLGTARVIGRDEDHLVGIFE
jgi:hypothetical protein